MFSLSNCIYYECLMNGSMSMEEHDSKPSHYCPVCLRKLQANIGFKFDIRYYKMAELCYEYSEAFVKAANSFE